MEILRLSTCFLNQIQADHQSRAAQEAKYIQRMSHQTEKAEVIQNHRNDKLADDGGNHRVGNADSWRQDQDGGNENNPVNPSGVIYRWCGPDLGQRRQWRVQKQEQKHKQDDCSEKRDKSGLQGVIKASAQVGVQRALDGKHASHAKRHH